MTWNGWPLERMVVLITGIGFLMIFVQVTLFHYRQNFRHWTMWIPVIQTPLYGVLLLSFVCFYANWFQFILTILLIIGILVGAIGSYLHVKGVGDRVDGYKLRNFLIGPPIMLPGMITALSILGLIALHWG